MVSQTPDALVKYEHTRSWGYLFCLLVSIHFPEYACVCESFLPPRRTYAPPSTHKYKRLVKQLYRDQHASSRVMQKLTSDNYTHIEKCTQLTVQNKQLKETVTQLEKKLSCRNLFTFQNNNTVYFEVA